MEKSELTDSLSQESSLSCPPEFVTLHHDPKVEGNLMTCEETRTDNTGIVSLNELEDHSISSKTIAECPKIDEVVHESSIEYTKDDVDHSSVSESSENDKEKEVFNLATEQSSQKETDMVTNDLKQFPLISTSVEECPKTDEVVCESSIRNANDDMDHSNVSESSESNKEQEVFNFATGQPLEKETDAVSTIIEACPKTDEVVHESAIRNTNDDIDHSSGSESSESHKEQEVLNLATEQLLDKETDIITNDLKQFPLVSTTVEECPKTDEVVYESAIRNANDDMDHSSSSQSSESDKEREVNFATGQSFEKEADIVTNDLKEFPLIGAAAEECLRTNEVVYESPTRNTNDDMDHSSVSESSDSDQEQEAFNFASGQPSEKETNIITDDLKHFPLISTTVEECPDTDEKVDEPAIKNINDAMDHHSVSESSESDKEHGGFKLAKGQPSEKETGIVTNDLNQFPLQNNSVELMNQSSSDDEGQNDSISCDDLQEGFAYEFNIIRAHDPSVPMDSDVESLDGSNVSEIEGESIVDRLKRQVEYDKKCINSLYKEFEEERKASEVAASQAMAMITRLQQEKAAMHMEALHYLRMMEEQAEYDVEALEKANELINEKEREIQDLETELEYYRATYMGGTIVEIEEYRECNSNYSFKSAIAEATRRSNRSLNHQTSSLEFEDEKVYIQLCLKSLEDKINKISTNGILAKVPNCIDIEEVVNPKQRGEESIDAEGSQMTKEENGPSTHIDKNTFNGTVAPEEELVDPKNNGRFSGDENYPDMKGQISCANKREEVDFLALEHKISDLTGKLVALQADHDFLEHSLNSLRYGEEGLQFAQNIVHQLQELCKLGIRLDRLPGS
ncbi:myosin-binding protein 1-like isoform X2 [Momordica charantia]|uniref:Myosin-binding protein 1-like isoform X2 n=2 Tax=Momordica charantia TaxID=3673 RepID=A0A6J1CVX5_MOMCH|nr:myosin-binding protein 1-like isoform X2 [Momordica charantia]